MNHPLSRNELSADRDDSESPEGTPVPSWLTQHYRDDDAEFLVNQYRRKQEEEPEAASPPPENRTYEYYRRRIMERQREQLDVQMDRAPMPRVPSRPTIPVSELEVQHRHYDRETGRTACFLFPQLPTGRGLRRACCLQAYLPRSQGELLDSRSQNMTRFRISQ